MLRWQWAQFTELSTLEWYSIAAAREAVFVVEQRCAYLDHDGWDPRAMHLVAWEGNEVAAYLRAFAPGVKWPEASLGRILTTAPFRGTGVGRELVARGLAYLDERFPESAVRIGAQSRLEKFYNSFGFNVDSPPYLEDDIPHVEMLRRAAS